MMSKSGERVLKMKGTSPCGRPQIIIVPPGFLKAAVPSTMPLKIAKISPKEPLKRPAPSPTPCESSLNPVRKRANLDHLSTEEKLLRRKLKNRVAAQNARDKKRVKMDEMEDEIQLLRNRNAALEEENRRLRELSSRLQPAVPFSLPLSPATSSTSSSCEEEELSTIITLESSPETNPSPPAERVNDLQQKGRVTILGALLVLMSLLHSLARRKKMMMKGPTGGTWNSPHCFSKTSLKSHLSSSYLPLTRRKKTWDSETPPPPHWRGHKPWSTKIWRHSLPVT